MAWVDAQRLAYVHKGERPVVVFGVDPVRSLEELEPLGRIPFGVTISEIASDAVLEQGEKKAALGVGRGSSPEQVVVLDRQDVGSLKYIRQFV